MTPLHYKERTSVSLNSVLLSHPYFKKHWKIIPSVIKLLNLILRWNHQDDGTSEITRTKWHDRFGSDYPDVRTALESLDLLSVNHAYRYTNDKTGECKTYLVTDKCCVLLNDHNKEYLYLLRNDPTERRRKQIRVSKRGHNTKRYGDTRDFLKAFNDSLEWDDEEIDRICGKMPAAKSAQVYSLLINIEEKDYTHLKHNKKDNRVWHPFAGLPAEIRAVIRIKGLSYLETMDIRSCYPSLWAEYVVSIASDKSALESERQKYNGIFLNKSLDPKQYLSEQLGIHATRIKDVLIQYYNGKRIPTNPKNAFNKYDSYLKQEFPLLYAAWRKTDIKQTGNNIGKYFETRLMLDKSIYKKAEQLGYAIGYEYDGMSIYGKNADNLSTLYDFIEQRSLELLGVALVIVKKDCRETIESLFAKSQIEILFEQVQHNDATMTKMRKRSFGRGEHDSWREYYSLKDENREMLRQINGLLPFHVL